MKKVIEGMLMIPLLLLVVEAKTHARQVVVQMEKSRSYALNDQPVVGILSQELSYLMTQNYGDQGYDSYIAASYVKFVEGAGARVVPIWINQPPEYYEEIMGNLNGVLLPGGATWFNQSNGYADAGHHIYDIARRFNDNGDYFPVWGTCLGFELLTYLAANGTDHRAHCNSSSQALALNFKDDFRKSRLFAQAPNDVVEILANEAVTANFHQFCITETNLTEYGLSDEWRVMSVNRDWNGMEFISTIEHKTYPFYGIQFHPEKNTYEWIANKNIPHTANAVRASQYFADFFIGESRRSDHRFPSEAQLERNVIYNYQPTFTGLQRSSFEQCYMFGGKVSGDGVYQTADEGDGNDASAVKLTLTCMLPILSLSIICAMHTSFA
ncbi:gamma-glutamyl hydrolase A-like isoform X1 [Anopheles cruzii]|uniref:gamma-glutamyl hydrolase A-like isoform X1 n=1 Tax=Anopheles cruzii TaxID=68878 RepID=UPI0022EC912A|nr:gamma-glutamyl hydrolase A-like isoform X1 [Anopheles cruzii]